MCTFSMKEIQPGVQLVSSWRGSSYRVAPEWESNNKELIDYVSYFYKMSKENARVLLLVTPLAERERRIKFQTEMLEKTSIDLDFEHLQNLLRNKK